MTHDVTMRELTAMPLPDLLREIKAQTLLVEQLRVGVSLKKEKDTAKLTRARRQLARMLTERTRKTQDALPDVASVSTVSSAPAAATARGRAPSRKSPKAA